MKTQTTDSPKFRHLCRDLSLPYYVGVGLLESLWLFTKKNAPQGDIGRWSDEDICESIGWQGEPGELMRVLVHRGWLDECQYHRLVIHDWPEHCDNSTKKWLQNKKMKFAIANIPDNLDSPVTHMGSRTDIHTDHQPNLTIPYLTLPNQKGEPPLEGDSGGNCYSVGWMQGEVPSDLIEIVCDPSLSGHEQAGQFTNAVTDLLQQSGWSVEHEVPCEDRGDGRPGHIDLVASREGKRVAIECDRDSARKKSIAKLQFYGGDALVLTRGKSYSMRVWEVVPESLQSTAFMDVLMDYISWRRGARKKDFPLESWREQFAWMANDGPEKAMAALKHSKANNYAGIVPAPAVATHGHLARDEGLPEEVYHDIERLAAARPGDYRMQEAADRERRMG